MHTHTIYLQQHTPIIHFQAEQEGATLRATELKPKLDRLITRKLSLIDDELMEEFEGEIQLVKDAVEHKKPLYSIKIRCVHRHEARTDVFQYYYFDTQMSDDEKQRIEKKLPPQLHICAVTCIAPAPYFANRDKVKEGEERWEEVRLGVLWTGYIELTISSWQEGVVRLLKKAAPYLFMIENFGTRQSKGFGCFSTVPKAESTKLHNALSYFDFASKKKAPEKIAELFKEINNTYKTLKTKPGKGKGEVDSKLRDYFLKEENIQWEREFVRDRLAKKNNLQSEVKYVRALLGLAESYDYQDLKPEKPSVKIQHTAKRIERFKSPITFKVYQNQLYLLANSPNNDIFSQSFQFYVGDNLQEAINNQRIETIETPDAQSFDIVEFLKNSLNKSWRNV